MLAGDVARGVCMFLLFNGCLALGIAFGGYVLTPPAWSPRNMNFNLVAILQYLSQAFHGSGWLGMQLLQRAAGRNPDALFSLHRLSIQTYSDIGCLHLVVAGALNYVATVRLWDLLAGSPELTGPAKPAEPAKEVAA